MAEMSPFEQQIAAALKREADQLVPPKSDYDIEVAEGKHQYNAATRTKAEQELGRLVAPDYKDYNPED